MTSARFWGLSLAGALVSIALGWGFISASAPTYDEPVHLASGYLALTTSLPPINYRDHPPLAEMWAALPLLRFRLSKLLQSAQWGRLYNFSDAFLYSNTVPAQTLLDSARRWCLVSWTLLLAPAVVAWGGAAGAPAAAALLLAFCPPLFSNAALVGTDAAAAVFYFLAFWLAGGRRRDRWTWPACGAAVGLGLASKFSMIVLPVLLIAGLLTEARLTRRAPLRPRDAALAVLCALLVLTAVYRFRLPLFWEGLSQTLGRLDRGRSSFLGGRFSVTGSVWYFPIALAIKTPLPLLAAAALGAAAWAAKPDLEAFWALFPPAAFFALACTSKTQIGYRHILPVYPFLIVAGARGAAALWERRLPGRLACGALAAWLAFGVLRARPDYLAYFNELSGGPENGYRWLVDSNLDWGQGLKELGAELERRGRPVVYLSYFGTGDPSYYGIRYVPTGVVSNVDRRDGAAPPPSQGPVLLAVSATNLQGVYYADKGLFAWLKDRSPAFSAGHSIFLYDLTDDADGRSRLRAMTGAGAARR